MNVREKLFVIALGALSTLGSSLLLPGSVLAQGQQTCNGFLGISYPEFPKTPPCTSPNPAIKCTQVGATCQCFIDPSSMPTIKMEIGLAAGDITGGTNLQVFNFVTALDCRRFFPLPSVDTVCAPNPDGPRVTFTDAVTTTCPSVLGGVVPWIVTPALGFPPPNSELFTAPLAPPTPPLTPVLQIPANSTNPFCTTDLTFTVNTPPTDAKCTTGAAPLNCCTGAGTGFCQQSDNAACTDVLTPFPCCTGAGDGFCGFTDADCTGPLQPVACCVGAGVGFCDVIQSGSNASCTTGPAPFSCCTGAGTGFCECKDNAACTGFLQPFPCCRAGTGVGNCGDIFQLSEYVLAQCDNHVLESSQTQTAELPVCVITPPSNFNCYQIPRHDAGKPIGTTVHLVDAFTAPSGVDLPVGRPHWLCAPANLNDQTGTNFNGDHLEAIDYINVGSSFPTKTGVTVTNVFGTVKGDVKGTPAKLLVPTGKNVPVVDPNHPHFQCYPFVNTKGAGKSASGVTTDDQFGMLGPFKIGGNLLLCASVNKNGGDPGAVTNPQFVLCYPGTPKFGMEKVTLDNQFGMFSTTIDNYDDLCVSSTIM